MRLEDGRAAAALSSSHAVHTATTLHKTARPSTPALHIPIVSCTFLHPVLISGDLDPCPVAPVRSDWPIRTRAPVRHAYASKSPKRGLRHWPPPIRQLTTYWSPGFRGYIYVISSQLFCQTCSRSRRAGICPAVSRCPEVCTCPVLLLCSTEKASIASDSALCYPVVQIIGVFNRLCRHDQDCG